jgi:hypothetical protein
MTVPFGLAPASPANQVGTWSASTVLGWPRVP